MREIPATEVRCTRCTFERDVDPTLHLCASCLELERLIQDRDACDTAVMQGAGIAPFDTRKAMAEVIRAAMEEKGLIRKPSSAPRQPRR